MNCFGWFFFINIWKICHFWSYSISYSFVGICDIYLENGLSNLYCGFDVEKTIPIYVPTHLLIFFHIKSPIIY